MSEGMNGKLWTIILTGVFALAGTVVGGWLEAESKIELERTKLDSSVISLALSQKTEKERQAFLEFLVGTNLIKDQETKEGLKEYFEGPNAKSPPFIAPKLNTDLTERTLENASNTDIDFFICEKDIRNEQLILLLQKSHAAISEHGEFGESKYKSWGPTLYKEVAEEELSGKATVIIDFDHPEYAEREVIHRQLKSVNGQLPIVFMDNRGSRTPWRLSVILCAE
ncbi:hypothetical protein [Neptuniibacter sp. QD57_21]|uniref:hypothetical protein n=1 Tax=Neptuniibacter sp. QD57_21 TaxID=3398213 RepID=UPI0039F5232A